MKQVPEIMKSFLQAPNLNTIVELQNVH